MEAAQGGASLTLAAPLSALIPVHVRGGAVFVRQTPAMSTGQQRGADAWLVAALASDLGVTLASGELIVDDGERDASAGYNRTQVFFQARSAGAGGVTLSASLHRADYAPAADTRLASVRVLGMPCALLAADLTLRGASVSLPFAAVRPDGARSPLANASADLQYAVNLSGAGVSIADAWTLALRCSLAPPSGPDGNRVPVVLVAGATAGGVLALAVLAALCVKWRGARAERKRPLLLAEDGTEE